MTQDIHAEIADFLQNMPIQHCCAGQDMLKAMDCTKAGLLAFLPETPKRYCVMKPVAAEPSLGSPEYQICKGTRMGLFYHEGTPQWLDLKGGRQSQDALSVESLAETALREAVEEIGINLNNVMRMFDLGKHHFTSATTGKSKSMWLFAAEVFSMGDFLPETSLLATTAGRQWCSAQEFQAIGRSDHAKILTAIDRILE